MKPETLIALQKSINHWRANERATHPSNVRMGATHCALCALYRAASCDGCPIAEQGYRFCDGTPYDDAYQMFEEWEHYQFRHEWMLNGTEDRPGEHPMHMWLMRWQTREAFRLAARDERLFLESLLP